MREGEREHNTQVKLELHQFVSASQGLETIKATNQHTRQRKSKTLIYRSNNINISKTNNYMHRKAKGDGSRLPLSPLDSDKHWRPLKITRAPNEKPTSVTGLDHK